MDKFKNSIIKYKDRLFIGVRINPDIEQKVKEIFPRHGCPECHFCDMSKRFICCNDGISEQIHSLFGGCNGFDNKKNIIFIEILEK